MEQHRLGPALAGSQHVTIGKTPTGGQAGKILQRCTPGQQVTHVHIDRLETRPVKRRRHLDVTIDTLLAQHRHTWTVPLTIQWRGDVLIGIEGHLRSNARIFCIQQAIVFLTRAGRIITQRLHVIGGGRPDTLQLDAWLRQQGVLTDRHGHPVVCRWMTNGVGDILQPVLAQHHEHTFQPVIPHLDHRPEFLGKQGGNRVVAQPIEVHTHAAMAGKGHLA